MAFKRTKTIEQSAAAEDDDQLSLLDWIEADIARRSMAPARATAVETAGLGGEDRHEPDAGPEEVYRRPLASHTRSE